MPPVLGEWWLESSWMNLNTLHLADSAPSTWWGLLVLVDGASPTCARLLTPATIMYSHNRHLSSWAYCWGGWRCTPAAKWASRLFVEKVFSWLLEDVSTMWVVLGGGRVLFIGSTQEPLQMSHQIKNQKGCNKKHLIWAAFLVEILQKKHGRP